MPGSDPTPRLVLRAVLIVVAVALTLYVIYLLRTPLSWIIIAAFIAVAVSGPVNYLTRVMKRGLAIATVYVLLVLVPFALAALVIPGVVNQAEDLAGNAPQYAQDVTEFVNENETLNNLNEKYDLTGKLQEEAEKLPEKLGDAAGVLRDIGVGVVNSIFTGVTIFILSIFMVASGRRWVERFLESRDPDHAERISRALDHIGSAVGNYVGGVLVQATIAGISSFIVLSILGVPFAAPLALLVFLFDLIPVVGATIAAVAVAIVTIFVDFPVALIVWALYAIVYQQIENYVIQPQIQRRAVAVEPLVILIAVLFGATLFGVPGALLAIPAAASIQIALREWMAYRRDVAGDGGAAAPGGAAEAGAPP